MSLPLVGVHGGLDSTMGGTSSTGFSLARQDLTAQLSTPGALALRKVTTLLQGPRRDAPGEHQQAQELYSEVLKVHLPPPWRIRWITWGSVGIILHLSGEGRVQKASKGAEVNPSSPALADFRHRGKAFGVFEL
eukprot:symbB.v1.2.023243.t1/scaffold2077.1/size90278/3